MLAAGSLVALAACSPAAEQPEAPETAAERPMPAEKASLLIQDPADAEFLSVPGVPECVTMAPLNGNLGEGAGSVMVRMTDGCVVPYHWHQTSEELIQLRGRPYMQLADGEPYYLETLSYSQLPGGTVHRFRCDSPDGCIMVLVADAAFDTHFVDEEGNEIPTEDALAAAAEPSTREW